MPRRGDPLQVMVSLTVRGRDEDGTAGDSVVSGFGRTGVSAGISASSGSGNRSTNSRTTGSGSIPIASAYERIKDFLKIPDGQRDTSSRSRPSSSGTPIFVDSAI